MTSESDQNTAGKAATEGEEGKTVEQDIKWDEQYDNPASEIVLVSSDRVGFRVDAWVFKKKSDFITDLLTIPSDQSIHTAQIDVDQESSIVRAFVLLVYASDGSPIKLDTEGFKALFSLCDRFQAPSVIGLVSKSIRLRLLDPNSRKELEPWDIFNIAAQMNDSDLAQAAIRTGGADVPRFEKRSLQDFDGIPGRYCVALLRRSFQREWVNLANSREDAIMYRPATSEQIADGFRIV